jgi:hypothetical protein
MVQTVGILMLISCFFWGLVVMLVDLAMLSGGAGWASWLVLAYQLRGRLVLMCVWLILRLVITLQNLVLSGRWPMS